MFYAILRAITRCHTPGEEHLAPRNYTVAKAISEMQTNNNSQNSRTNYTYKSFIQNHSIAVFLILFLIGILLIITGKHGELKLEELYLPVGEFICFVVAMHFLYESLTKIKEHNVLTSELSSMLSPQREKIDSLRKQLDDLNAQTEPILNISRYSSDSILMEKWIQIVSQNANLYLIGNFPLSFIENEDIQKNLTGHQKNDRKTVKIFCTAGQTPEDEIIKILNMSSKKEFNISVYHIDRIDWGFLLIGTNLNENIVEILVSYTTPSLEDQYTYYVFGETALSLMQSLKPRLSEIPSNSSPYDTQWAVKIDNDEVLKFLLRQKFIYRNELSHLSEQGVPLKGKEDICKKMSSLLMGTEKTLKVTHVAKEESIEMMKDKCFEDWIFVNYKAIKEHSIEIKRIFIIPQAEIKNDNLRKLMQEMKNNGVDVWWCILEELDHGLHEDFSIYDGKHVVFIFQPYGGSWIVHRTEARYSTDQKTVRKYEVTFSMIEDQSKSFDELIESQVLLNCDSDNSAVSGQLEPKNSAFSQSTSSSPI